MSRNGKRNIIRLFIAGLFVADNVKKNSKLITILSGVVAILGLLVTAKVLDEELYPEDFIEEEIPEEE